MNHIVGDQALQPFTYRVARQFDPSAEVRVPRSPVCDEKFDELLIDSIEQPSRSLPAPR
ncbi:MULTISPECIES: hypothetical protein [Streptomyces]|uniref:hypothetical protein n=1 Tax=Streptomyces sp. 12257 TaxID=3041009 RepID=UPI0021F1B2D8|nr:MULTISPECIES: hypothetical protein [Streptomyces]MDI5910552.1 hypothetical protein [Streptomyces sp. 12257]